METMGAIGLETEATTSPATDAVGGLAVQVDYNGEQ